MTSDPRFSQDSQEYHDACILFDGTAMTCPFCTLPGDRVTVENTLALAFGDGYPVSPGHTLIVPRRHVATWFDATDDERQAIMSLVDQVKAELDRQLSPAGYNIGINAGEAAGQTVMHLHVHLIPRFEGDIDDPTGGVRLVIPEKGNYKREGRIPRVPASGPGKGQKGALASGGHEDQFIEHIKPLFEQGCEVSILAAFVQDSGVVKLRKKIASCLERGCPVRILTGDYLELTQARALRHLLDLMAGEVQDEPDGEEARPASEGNTDPVPRGSLQVRVVEVERLVAEALGASFHPKAWIFDLGAHDGAAFVGSSNLSQTALTSGVEWNLRVDRARDPESYVRVREAFDHWWSRGRVLDDAWLESYAIRARDVARRLPIGELESEILDPPKLWGIQNDALAALRRTRQEQHRERALVVMATGLGKTMLSASDVDQFREELGRMPRVLFIAHRVELLRQAAATFRRFFRDQRFGWYAGPVGSLTGDVVFASVMKIGRPDNLQQIEPRAFDYVVVDEVHHADAATYRRILSHLQPRFLLGITATPERADAGDILGLFDDRVVFEADIGVGVTLGHLVPFRYHGLKDVIDYAPIPWRNRRFDPAELARAAETEARMERMWEGWQAHPGKRTLVFCCSITHAGFVRSWLEGRDVRVAAVHSGEGSDDREGSLERLAAGKLDAVCTVDLFNEGVDVPAVDRVVMLRPTESPVIFLQQLGRGLRTAPELGKEALTVIDFVGNHHVFLDRVRTLLSLAPGRQSTSVRDLVEKGTRPELPEGCSVDLELEAVELLKKLLPSGHRHKLVQKYRELRQSRDQRPTLGELYRLGYNPRTLKGFEGWFDFVRSEEDLTPTEEQALACCGEWLVNLEVRESMNKSYKMVALQALLEAEGLGVKTGMGTEQLAERSYAILHRCPELLAELPGEWRLDDPSQLDLEGWRRYWEQWPLAHWAGHGPGRKSRAWFRLEDERLSPAFELPGEPAALSALASMSLEVVDFRLARYRRSKKIEDASAEGARAFVCKVIHTRGTPIIKLPDRERFPSVPMGETDVTLPDGSAWRFRFVKVACNVAHPVGRSENTLPDVMRGWFGPDAGAPGTDFRVRFSPGPDGWRVEPFEEGGADVIPLPRRGRLPAFPTLRAAAGWDASAIHEGAIEPSEVLLPGEHGEDSFAIRASGRSMEGLQPDIHDGDWLVMRWARGARVGAVEGRVALIARGHPEEGRSFHLKRVVRGEEGKFELRSDNPEVPAAVAGQDDQVVGLLRQVVRPEELAPERGAEVPEAELAAAFGLSEAPEAPWRRVDGHLFVLVEGDGSLQAPDRVAMEVDARRKVETAFVLGLVGEDWVFLGVGRWLEDDRLWAIPDVDHRTWKALGQGRSASRSLDEQWIEAARQVVGQVLGELGHGAWIERGDRRCRVVGRADKGGLRIDGGEDGFKERTVSLLDIGWVLRAQEVVEQQGRELEEELVNELRYLDGTPKGATRWIDTGWAIAVVGAVKVRKS